MARGKSSIVHDVKAAINEIDMIGQSKRFFREKGEHGIHSLKQKKETLSAVQNFVKWTRNEFRLKRVYELKEEHYRAYLGHMEQKGTSVGHQRNIETALRHLQKGMNLRSEKFGKEKVVFVPEKRVTDWRKVKKPTDRSYSNEEYQKILNKLSANSRDAVKLCREIGLRVREAVRVEVQHFKFDGTGWKLKIENGSGITKGGRFREVPVPEHFKDELERMMNGKQSHEKLVPIKWGTVRNAVNKACKEVGVKQNERGTHGFRHAYSRERVKQLFRERGIVEQGKKMIDRIMANRDQNRSANYGILSERDKRLFNQVKVVIDVVHGEIGHGKDRWDLAAVYMR